MGNSEYIEEEPRESSKNVKVALWALLRRQSTAQRVVSIKLTLALHPATWQN